MRQSRGPTSSARRLRRAPVIVLVAASLLISPHLISSATADPPVSGASPGDVDTVSLVNPLIGTAGANSTEYGGMVPSAAPPFAMTKWTPATRENYISRVPYHHTDRTVSGFIGSHQPAIWMGDWGYVTVMPGAGEIKPTFSDRALSFDRATEKSTASEYNVVLDANDGGKIGSKLTGTSRVGYLDFNFDGTTTPNVVIQATRGGVNGQVNVDPANREITGYNPDRQDAKYGPFKAPGFKGYFVARFDTDFASHGTANGATTNDDSKEGTGSELSAYVRFPDETKKVSVRIGVSLISIDQARDNLNREVPDGTSFDTVATQTRDAWSEKLDRVQITGGTTDQLTNFYTAMYHALQYPAEINEYGRYYSAYDDSVHEGDVAYTAYSLWDTFRAQNALLTLMAPERVDGMVTSMLHSYQEGGWLPMWQNLTETNIMVGSHSDSIIAEAVSKGFTGFDLDLAYKAVYKNAMTPPDRDTELRYRDREENTPVEARAGLTTYKEKGWVANDRWAEAGSRTLDYAYDDSGVAIVAAAAGHPNEAAFFAERSKSYKNLWNPATGFMQSRNDDGAWADGGWTEGNQWQYTFDVMHDVPGLVDLMGEDLFRDRLDEFLASHNRHDNEPSHHISYLPAMTGQPWKTQQEVRSIAKSHYGNAPDGLSGNDDLGQMSAWYVFSAMGFYPVNPSSDEYVIGTPLFEKMTIDLPAGKQPLVISGQGAAKRPYVRAVSLEGNPIAEPKITQAQLNSGGLLAFDLRKSPQEWAATTEVPPVSPRNVARGAKVEMINGTPAVSWGKPVTNAVDGNLGSMAQSTSDKPWSLKVDLGASYRIDKAVVDPDWENYPVDYSIEVSSNGTDWKTVGTVIGSGTDVGCQQSAAWCGTRTESSFAPIDARYMQLTVDSWKSATRGDPPFTWGWALREFEVYEIPMSMVGPTVNIKMSAPNESGWYTSAPAATITAVSADSGDPIIEYRIGATGLWNAYTDPVELRDSDTVIQARAWDENDNDSEVIEQTFKIDTILPEVAGAVSEDRVLTVTSSDLNLASTQYSLGDTWLDYTGGVKLSDSAQEVKLKATDLAGNVSPIETIEVGAAGGPGPTTPPGPGGTTAPTNAPDAANDPGKLPVTGVGIALAGLGALLLVAGVVVVMIRRRFHLSAGE